MSSIYDHPLPGFRFQVDFKEQMLGNETEGGEVVLCSGAFSECNGLEASMEPMTIQEGGRNWGSPQRMGRVNFGTVILKRGLTKTDDLWTWFNLVGQGAYAQRLNVSITMFDQAGNGVFSWTLLRAMPVKFKAPDLSGGNNQVAIEELHLVHEGLARDNPGLKNL